MKQNEEKKKIIGLDVGGTKTAICLVDPWDDFAILDKRKMLTNPHLGREHVLCNINSTVDDILSSWDMTYNNLLGVGITLPGPVDSTRGVVIECPNMPGWKNFAVQRMLESRWKLPVIVENDAHAAALAEAKLGSGKSFSTFLYVGLGTGIGCGVIIDGRIYKGADGIAGELSHILFENEMSLHELASGKAIQKQLSIHAEELIQRCDRGDIEAKKAYANFINILGIGIANAVTLFNPEAVVIGGGLTEMGASLLVPLEKKIRQYAFSINAEKCTILPAAHRHDAGIYGITSLVWERTAEKEHDLDILRDIYKSKSQ